MSIHVISWVLKHSNAKGNDRLALIVFADHAGEDGGASYPSASTIALEGRMDRSTAVKVRKRLAKQGRILPDGKDPHGKGITSYRVRMDLEAEGPPPEIKRERGGRDNHPPEGGGDSPPGGSDSAPPGGGETRPKPSNGNRPSEPSTTSDAFGADVVRLTGLLVDHVERETGDRKDPPPAGWLDAIDKMLRLDDRTPEQIEYVIEWMGSDFWGSVVLSGPKLREKWPQIVAKIKRTRNGRRSVGPSGDDLRQQAEAARKAGR